MEGAVAVTQQDSHDVRFAIGHGEIGDAVAVEIPDCHEGGTGTSRMDGMRLGSLEAAVTVAKEHAHAILDVLRRMAGITHNQEVCRQRAITLAQQDAHREGERSRSFDEERLVGRAEVRRRVVDGRVSQTR